MVYFSTTRYGLFHYEPDLVYFTTTIWSTEFTTTISGLFHYEPNLVYFTMTRWGLFHYKPDLVYFTKTRCGLFHYEPDLVYFTMTRCGLFHYEPDLVYFTMTRSGRSEVGARSGLLHYLSSSSSQKLWVSTTPLQYPLHTVWKASSGDCLWQCMPFAQLLSQQRASTLPEHLFPRRSFPLAWSQRVFFRLLHWPIHPSPISELPS